MTELLPPETGDGPAAASDRSRRTRPWGRIVLGAMIGVVVLALALVAVLDTGIGHRFLTDRIAALRPSNGLRYQIGRIDGSIYGKAVLIDVRVRDRRGLVFAAPRAELDWTPLRWMHNRLDITRLHVAQGRLERLPDLIPSTRKAPILPSFDIRIGALAVDRLELAKAVTGTERVARLAGRADLRDGRALVDLDAAVAGSDTLRLKLDAAPDRNRFDIVARARGKRDGLLAKLAGFPRPIALDVTGRGTWQRWDGSAIADVGTVRLIDLKLTNRAGRYALAGVLTPAPLAHGKLQRLSTPRVLTRGSATLVDRQLTGTLSLRSASLNVTTAGRLDLAANAFRAVKIDAVLLRPSGLFPNMTGRAIELRVLLDGAFATAWFDYRLAAKRFAFDDTGFEDAYAAGSGRLSKAPVLVPVRFVAARVTGVGDVAGGILRNLTMQGVLRVTATTVTGDDLRLTSDKLNGRFNLQLDLRNGRYEIALNGGLKRYLIPGLGIVDVATMLKVVPGADGHGTRVIGQGSAQMVRLDNVFFRSLAGGLPRIVTGLERTTDGVLHLNNLVLTGPQIRITGNGIRRRDGTFHFEGTGTQQTYGPLTLKLDGKIDRPTLDLTFQHPNDTLGLRDVVAHLDPTNAGFAFTARGGSRLGPFTGTGAILLPKGGGGTITIADLAVSGSHVSGPLAIVDGGFDGRLAVTGGGLSGALLFAPVGDNQRIEAHLDARGATLADGISVRRAHLDAVALLDPAGTSIEATLTGAGLRRGSLVLARFGGKASLRGGTGTIAASIAGSGGRAFDIQSITQVTPDRYTISAQGTLDRRPIRLVTPAVVSRDGEDGWRLVPTRLTFAGGDAQLAGRFTRDAAAIEAKVAHMPLAILDIGYPGLGLGGSASGSLSYSKNRTSAPTGRIDMTIRGLTRSGLVLTSRAVDVGVAGVLSADRIAARAVAATGGRTVGRAQLLLTLPAGADLAQRVQDAGVFAQLRYDGAADTLWRLTGIELFDLTGPVAIGADVGGRVRDPQIKGVVQARGARIESTTTGTVLTNVVANGQFGGSRLTIDTFTADAGKGGRVTGKGAFDFGANSGFDLAVQADHAVMIARDDIGATVTGPLRFLSNKQGGTISGELRLDKSRYRLGQATAASAVPQLNIREINLPGGGTEDDDIPRTPWRLAIHARAPNQVIVSGLGLRSEWSADLKIGGAPDNPAISGRADLVRGNYDFAGRTFALERGKILFTGDVPANPALDIAANASTTGLNATINVTGPALKPEIAFSSVPALPQDELLSRLLFGTSITNLSAPEALQLASAVAALQNGRGGLDPINAVRRVAGLDRLRIVSADPQTGQRTSVAAGKYITRRFYAEIVTDGAGYSATQVEFQVTRWLSVLSSISTLGRQSANLRVSKDY